jgi:hypothetical protein
LGGAALVVELPGLVDDAPDDALGGSSGGSAGAASPTTAASEAVSDGGSPGPLSIEQVFDTLDDRGVQQP